MAGDALNHLGNLVVCQVVHRMHLDAGALHPLLIGHLTNVCVNLVDRQARAGFKVA